jgi:hypothetical protein
MRKFSDLRDFIPDHDGMKREIEDVLRKHGFNLDVYTTGICYGSIKSDDPDYAHLRLTAKKHKKEG